MVNTATTPSRRMRGGGGGRDYFHDEEGGQTLATPTTAAATSNTTTTTSRIAASPSVSSSAGARRGGGGGGGSAGGGSAGTAGGAGMGRYRQVMDVTGMMNGISSTGLDDMAIDTNLTTLEEYQKSVEIMKRQRRWIRCLSILALALAIDVIFLSIKLTKNNKEMETIIVEQQQQQQQQEKEEQGKNEKNESTTTSIGSNNTNTNTNTNNSIDASTSSRFLQPPNWLPLPSVDQVITKLAFGSSSSQYMPQPYWDTVVQFQPDLLILGGDNVYGDCSSSQQDDDDPTATVPTCQELQDAYKNWTQHHASFQGAIERFPIIATLDDHDYGFKHADKTNPYKKQAKELFHEFYHHLETAVPNDEDDGVFQEYTFGPPGKRLQVILLDTRYHRDPFPPNTVDNNDGEDEYEYVQTAAGEESNVTTEVAALLVQQTLPVVPPKAPYKPSTSDNQHMLSSRQWDWLSDVLQQPDIQLRFLVSSIQILNDGTGYECWRHLPKERERLYSLLRQESTSPIYLLSGDRYVGGFYQYDFDHVNDTIIESISDFTTPTTATTNNNNLINMTTATTTARSTTTPRDDDDDDNEEDNDSNQVLPSPTPTSSSLMEVTASSWTHTIPYGAYDDCSDATTCDEVDPNRVGDFVRENNFATIEIDWTAGSATIALRRVETPPAYLYHGPDNHKTIASTGQILQSRSFQFLLP